MRFRRYIIVAVSTLASPSLLAQSAPLDRVEILGRLASGYAPSYIAHLVRTRGVEFPVSADFLDRVKAAGGGGVLLERLSSAERRSPPSGTPAQVLVDHLARCAELVHIGDTDLAKEECDAAIDENPASPWPLVATARLTGGTRRGETPEEMDASWAEQRQLFRRALSVAPDLPILKNPRSFGFYFDVKSARHEPSLDNEELEQGEDEGVYDRVGYVSDPHTALELDESEYEPLDSLRPEINGAVDVISRPSDPGSKERVPNDGDLHRIQLDPDLASTHAHLAIEYATTHQQDRALGELREAMRLEPDNAELHAILGQFYFAEGNAEAGLAEFRETIRIGRSSDGRYVDLADKLEELGRTSEAIKLLREIVSIHPAGDYPNDALVQLYRKHKEFKSAVEVQRGYLKALSAHFADQSKFVDMYFIDLLHLAGFISEGGDLDGAIEQYKFLLHFKPENAVLRVEYGNVLSDKRQFDEAISEFEKALQLDPTMSSAHVNIGLCLAVKHDTDGAIEHYRRAIELEQQANNPEEVATRDLLGRALGNKKDFNGALEQFQEAIKLDPKDALAHADAAYALLLLKDEPSALNEVNLAEDLHSDSPEVRNILAEVYINARDWRLRNPAHGLDHARHAAESLPPNPIYLDTLARALMLNAHFPEALAAETRAAELDPDDPVIKSHLDYFRGIEQTVNHLNH